MALQNLLTAPKQGPILQNFLQLENKYSGDPKSDHSKSRIIPKLDIFSLDFLFSKMILFIYKMTEAKNVRILKSRDL